MEVVGFLVVVALWIAFATALLFSQSSIHDIWTWFKSQFVIVQVPVGVLFLPWVVAMWIWESTWPIAARGLVVGGVAWANVYAFSPWKIG